MIERKVIIEHAKDALNVSNPSTRHDILQRLLLEVLLDIRDAVNRDINTVNRIPADGGDHGV